MAKVQLAVTFALILTGSCLTVHEPTGALKLVGEATTKAACLGNPDTWDAGYGPCSSYTIEDPSGNNYFCDQDEALGFTAQQVCSECGVCTGRAGATGDPHLVSVKGEKFDVNQPGEYMLVRVPSDRKMPAMLEMNVSLKPSDGEICGLWIQRVQFGGSLFDNLVVNVWPEMRSNGAEHCSAESVTVRPFAFQVEGGHGPGTGNYIREQSHAFQAPNATIGRTWTSCPGRQDRKCVDIVPRFKTVRDRGQVYESESFKLPITSQKPVGRRLAEMEVSRRRLSPQSCRQALDVPVKGLGRLGFKEIGGLLGTEGHDAFIEQLPSDCAALEKVKGAALEKVKGNSRVRGGSGSNMFAK